MIKETHKNITSFRFVNNKSEGKNKSHTINVTPEWNLCEEVRENDSITITIKKKYRENRMKSFGEHNVTKMCCWVDRAERHSSKSSRNILVRNVGQREMVVL